MDLLTLILIILVIAWVIGGVALPTGGLLNLLIAIVVIVLIFKVIKSA